MGELHHEVSGFTYMECSDDEKEGVSPVSLGKNIPGRGRGKACSRNRLGGRGRSGGRWEQRAAKGSLDEPQRPGKEHRFFLKRDRSHQRILSREVT